MTEAEFTGLLTACLRQRDLLAKDGAGRGWFVSHDPDSRGQRTGEPDLWCVWLGPGPCPGPVPVFWAELKARGQRTDAQRTLANALIAHGQAIYEWRVPADMALAEQAFGIAAGTLTGETIPEPYQSHTEPVAPRRSVPAETMAAAQEWGPRVAQAMRAQHGG